MTTLSVESSLIKKITLSSGKKKKEKNRPRKYCLEPQTFNPGSKPHVRAQLFRGLFNLFTVFIYFWFGSINFFVWLVFAFCQDD